MADSGVATTPGADTPRVQTAISGFSARLREPGALLSLPVVVFLLIGFIVPLLIVAIFAVMPARTFSLTGTPTLANFGTILEQGYWRSYLWSVVLAALTVAITLVLSYPLAYGLARLFGGKWAAVIVILVAFPLLVSENIRLLGWTLILVKNGVLGGTIQSLFDVEVESMLYNVPSIVLGLVYVYLPFMLFPMVLGLSLVPVELMNSARDLGASRWQAFWEIEVPLAKPGVLIGVLLTFVLSMGSVAEALILGGKNVVMIVTDIERAFSYQQNWPLGSALSLLLIVLAGVLVWALVRRLDMDMLLHRED